MVGVRATAGTLCATLAVYAKVPLLNVGLRAPALGTSDCSVASGLPARCTVTEYEVLVTPSCAVHTTSNTVSPFSVTLNPAEACVETIACPFTLPIVAAACCVVAVRDTVATELATSILYTLTSLENPGDMLPAFTARACSALMWLG